MATTGYWGPGGMPVFSTTGSAANPGVGGVSGTAPGQSVGQNTSTQQSTNLSASTQGSQSTSGQQSSTYIPEYSQTPILEEIAKYSRDMAPRVYDWGMQQFNKNQGNIDTLMRNALSYASPQRMRANMGMAEAGVQQGVEAGRQSALRDLQSFGIDPSSGRYAALDNASRVQGAASAAGAGNQQRMADTAQGNTMVNQAISSGLSNVQTGYGAANAANALLGTASSLKYSPLGTASTGTSQSTSASDSFTAGQSTGGGTGWTSSQAYDPAIAARINAQGQIDARMATPIWQGGNISGTSPAPMHGGVSGFGYAEGGEVDDDATTGGFVSQELSPSNGGQTDDVDARLNAGEFVIPKDVAQWKGQEFFYKLMAQARQMRARAGSESQMQVGYGAA